MLTALLIIPLVGLILVIMTNQENKEMIKKLALMTTLVNFVLSLVVWGNFDSSSTHYQFVQEWKIIDQYEFHLGIDGISLYFVILTTFIIPFCILSNWNNINHHVKYYLIAFLLIESILVAVFIVIDLLMFYITFESILIPLFLVIGIWGGSQMLRIRATFLLFLYTLAGSLFILLAILYIYNLVGTTNYTIISLTYLTLTQQKLLWLAFFLAFAIKMPLYPFYLWLFRAHAEAPLAGSVLLAGVILKLAVYGCLRILLGFIPDASSYFSPFVQTLALLSIIYSSFATIRQTDFKTLVAYSSIGHIGVVVLGLFSNSIIGIEGAIILSVAHGLISPALFILVGGVLYDRFHTRTIRYYRGVATYIPVFAILFFLATIFNIAVPLSINWIGEFLCLSGTFQRSPFISLLGASSIVLSACYSIYVFNRICFGVYSNYLSFSSDINRREFILLLPLLVITVVLGIYPNIILNDLHAVALSLIYK